MMINKSSIRSEYSIRIVQCAIPFLLFVIASFLLSSCNQAQDSLSDQISYFDLKSVVREDILQNKNNSCAALKTVVVDTVREEKIIAQVDWEKELQPILESDINKPAWKGKFLVDTLRGVIPGQYSVIYKSVSDKINIRLLRVTFNSGNLEKIYIVKQIQSFIFASNQTIEYFPRAGFVVSGEQRAAMMKRFNLNVEVKYRCK